MTVMIVLNAVAGIVIVMVMTNNDVAVLMLTFVT